jgi:hypothetical protein
MQSTITIQGVELELNLKVVYFYKFFQQLTGKDLLVDSDLSDAKGVKSFDYAAAFIAAGHQAHSKIAGTAPKMTKDAIEFTISSIPMEEAALIVVNMVSLINGGGDPNGKAPTKPGKGAKPVKGQKKTG